MTRDQALTLVNSWTKNKNLVKHMLAVEAQMRALAKHFGEDEDLWALVGLLHDADYEQFQDQPDKHPSRILKELESRGVDPLITQAIASHAWGHQASAPEPQSLLDWSLYICDDLSGLIIASALVHPEKKLATLTSKSILKKFKSSGFARGANRDQIALCQEKLDLSLEDFISLCLTALQSVSSELGL